MFTLLVELIDGRERFVEERLRRPVAVEIETLVDRNGDAAALRHHDRLRDRSADLAQVFHFHLRVGGRARIGDQDECVEEAGDAFRQIPGRRGGRYARRIVAAAAQAVGPRHGALDDDRTIVSALDDRGDRPALRQDVFDVQRVAARRRDRKRRDDNRGKRPAEAA